MTPTGYFYAYNSVSLYRTFSAYVRVTNDLTFLEKAQPFMQTLASFWRAYAKGQNSNLADYCGDPNCYLECVPTYTHVTAGLQASNAFMARDLAELLEAQGNVTAASQLRASAASITADTIRLMYVSNSSERPPLSSDSPGQRGGWWRCLNPVTSSSTEVNKKKIPTKYPAPLKQ
jgi:hypothetical protein